MAVKLNVRVPVLRKGYHRMTLDYGNTYKDGSFHKGIDLTGNPSVNDGYDDVVAIAPGTVTGFKNTMSGTTSNTGTLGMGNYVIIDHGNGYKTRYQHMKKGSVTVKKGDKVVKGQIIGHIGNTGNSTGRHLHFDISKNGVYVDPKPYLLGTKTIIANSTAKKAEYFPACSPTHKSIVDGLKSIGQSATYTNRKKIAAANGISNYYGSASQNIKMLDLLKQGKLIKP